MCDWCKKLWNQLFGGEPSLKSEQGGPRGTIRASIELAERQNIDSLRGENGKIVSKLEGEEGQDPGDMMETKSSVSPATRAKRAQRAQKHGFASKDPSEAQAAAKARVEGRTVQASSTESEGWFGSWFGSTEEEDITFTVKLARTDEKGFGLEYGSDHCVTGLQENSLIAEWNASNPSNAVVVGDKVTTVNGAAPLDDVLKMSDNESEIEITFCRSKKAS
mmetsp:Transcript_66374/g.104954  ORF Transcript_66374/g.104954 Transcript_66374/m.104954 type:complete len:220 (+) Transcript_66374:89-748(+)